MIPTTLWELRNLLRSSALSSHEALDAILCEACRQRGRLDLADGPQSSGRQRFRESPRYPQFARLVVDLLGSPRADLLHGFGQFDADAARSEPVWIQLDAAVNVARLARGWHSVRLAFEGAMLPALAIAVDAAEAERAVRIRLVCRSDRALLRARRMAVVLDVSLELLNADPLGRTDMEAGEDAFDGEVSVPPFGSKADNLSTIHPGTLKARGTAISKRLSTEALALTDLMVHGAGEGLILLPEGVLTRMVGAEPAVRDDLMQSGRLRAVLAAGGGLLVPSTTIRTAVLCLDRQDQHHDRVRMIDLGHDHLAVQESRGRTAARQGVSWDELLAQPELDPAWGRDVPREEILQQGVALAPERFLNVGQAGVLEAFLARHSVVPLGELVEIIRPTALKRTDEGVEIRDASPGDIHEDGVLREPERVIHVAEGDLRIAKTQQVQSGDVLLSIRGTIGAVGLVEDEAEIAQTESDAIWTAGQSFVILRPRWKAVDPKAIDPIVLYEFLSSDAARERLKVLASGGGVQSVAAADIKEFRIPLLPPEQQAQIIGAFRERQDLHRQAALLTRRAQDQRAISWPHRSLAAQGSFDFDQDGQP